MNESTFQANATSVSRQHNADAEGSLFVRIPWVTVLWVLFLICGAVFAVSVAAFSAILFTAAAFALFVLPGFFILPIFFADHPATRPQRAVIGAVFGIALSSYAAILVGFLYGWSPKAIALAIVALCGITALLGQSFKGRLNLPIREWTRIDYGILAAIGIVLVVFSADPAVHFGRLTSQGYAFTWLYGFDFIYRADVIQAMTVHMPPDWYWMSGIPLRMYLVGYAVPAFAYAASGKTLALHSILLLTTFACGFLMLASLFIFLRTLFSETKVLLTTLFVTLVAYSYYWVYVAGKALFLKPGQSPFGSISNVSHHLQRTLLVEPQAALATSLLLLVLATLALVRFRLTDCVLAVFVSLCLAISFGMEAMQGLLAVFWFALYYFARIVLRWISRERIASLSTQPESSAVMRFLAASDEFVPFLAAMLTCGLVCASFFALGMYQRSTSHLAPFAFSRWIAEFGLFYFLIDLGPILLLGVSGAIRWWRGSRDEFGWPLILLAAITLLQVLFVFQKPPARMADRILPFVLIPFVAYFIRDVWPARLSRPIHICIAAIILLGVPTFFTDIHFASAVNNPYDTRYVRPEDMQASQWIRLNLPETAVIQGDYDYFSGPDRGLYLSLIASFAQRPQVLGWTTNAAYVVDNGWPIARERRTDIQQMLSSAELPAVVRVARKYSIDYLYVGPFETGKYPQILPLLQGSPARFTEVYSQNGVHLFHFLR